MTGCALFSTEERRNTQLDSQRQLPDDVTSEPGQESEGPWPLGTQVRPRQTGVYTWAQGARFPRGCGERYPAESTEAHFVLKTTRSYHRGMTW